MEYRFMTCFKLHDDSIDKCLPIEKALLYEIYVWYYGGYVRITVTHRDFTEATECRFWKITVDYRDSGISTVIPNIEEDFHA
jgi:hypothetical protein